MSFQDQAQLIIDRQGSVVENPLIHLPITSYKQHSTQHPGAQPSSTWHVVLDHRLEAFHKPFSHVFVALAVQYGQHRREPPIHECVAWRLAYKIGAPLDEMVAPTVMRDRNGSWGSLCARLPGIALTIEPMTAVPELALATAFFDSLIAQQDRHLGNIHWDAATGHLGLFDHGYAFALPGDPINASEFVEERWRLGRQQLLPWERGALDDLLKSYELHGVARMLTPARAERLEERARLMLANDAILRKGEW